MIEVFTKEAIESVYFQLKSKKTLDRNKKLPIGIDGVSIDVFERNLSFSINEIHRKLQISNGKIPYRFAPLLRIERTKSQGGIRALHIPRLRDQIVLRLLHDELKKNAALHGIDIKVKSPYACVDQLHKTLRSLQDAVIIKTDISQFYDSVPRQKAIEKCRELGTRHELMQLLMDWSGQLEIRAGNFNFSDHFTNFSGLPQGLSISSLLAELYVKPIDYAFSHDVGYFRYIDDILIVCENRQDANQKLDMLRKITENIQLRLSSNKTEVVKIIDGVEWLGLQHFPGKIYIHPEKLTRSIKPISSFQKECLQEISFASFENEKRSAIQKFIKKVDKYSSGPKNVRVRWYSLIEDLGQWKKMDSYIHSLIRSCIRKAGLHETSFGDLPSVHSKVLSYKKRKESQE